MHKDTSTLRRTAMHRASNINSSGTKWGVRIRMHRSAMIKWAPTRPGWAFCLENSAAFSLDSDFFNTRQSFVKQRHHRGNQRDLHQHSGDNGHGQGLLHLRSLPQRQGQGQ